MMLTCLKIAKTTSRDHRIILGRKKIPKEARITKILKTPNLNALIQLM